MKTRDQLAREMFRAQGFDIESVRHWRHEGEFMVIKCWPARDTADVVELLTRKENDSIHITRIHVGRETYPGQPPVVRVYVAWDSSPEPRMSWDEINERVAKYGTR